MKKFLIILGLLALSANLFSMEVEHNHSNEIPKEQQLTNLEKIKIGGALFGCAFFTWAALLNPYAKMIDAKYLMQDENMPMNLDTIPYWPSMIALTPSIIMHYSLLFTGTSKGLDLNFGYKLSTAYSLALAFISGSYAYKKLNESKKTEAKKCIKI